MKTEARRLVETLYLNDCSTIYDMLSEFLGSKDEDALIVILREAIFGGYLHPCSKIAAIISGFISEYDANRSLLSVIGHGINDPTNLSSGCEWLDIILAENVEMDLDEWTKNWDKLDIVIDTRKMFAEARYSTAIDDESNPIRFNRIPAPSDWMKPGIK